MNFKHGHAAASGKTDESARDWLARVLPMLATRVRHPGCHKYAFGLDRAARRALPASLPYPKRREAA